VPTPPISVLADAPAAEVAEGMAAVRAELQVPERFPVVVDAFSATPWQVRGGGDGRSDRTAVELVTIDPPGSRDLDQAFAAERRAGGGIRVWYAIADVAAFVTPADTVDAEAHRRGVTFYGPDRRVPLHPPWLSEGAASLLPDGDRPALLWCIDLDADGAPVATRLERATVRSRAQLTYAEVTDSVAAGTADDALVLLREIGELRLAAEAARGGVSLPLPDQVVTAGPGPGDGVRLVYEAPVAAEAWNAQVSLLTGMEAARIMVAGGTGLLRTLPPAD
jgi:exoribonuclease R